MDVILARSKAGHDKNRIYVILGCQDDLLLLADGKYKSIETPKKKKEKHVQPIKQLPCNVREYLKSIQELNDTEIRKIIKLYNKESCQQGEMNV